MKKSFFVLLIILSTICFLQAQNKAQFGLKAGGNVCTSDGSYSDYHLGWNIQDEEIYADGSSFGYVFGAFVSFPISNKIFIKLEGLALSETLIYEYYLRSNYTNQYSSKEYDITKIEFPLLIEFFISKNIGIYAGPGYGIILSDEEDIAPSEFSICAGAEYLFNNQFSVDVRASFGLTNLYDGDGIGYLDLQPDFSTTGIIFTLGYMLK